MPVRLLNSSVFKWPNQDQVEQTLRLWTKQAIKQHPELLRLGYFGSYARGDWGVGSDLDLVALVIEAVEPFHRRALSWDLNDLSIPTDLLVYTAAEWHQLPEKSARFAETLNRETIWVYIKPDNEF